MQIDLKLLAAIDEYACLRKRINRGISSSVPGVPSFGGKDLLLWIEKLDRPNVTVLSEALGITRGGASKALGRLKADGLAEGYRLPGNKKEVYYRLTEKGKAAQGALAEALQHLDALSLEYIETLSDTRKRAALAFFSGITAHLASRWENEGGDRA